MSDVICPNCGENIEHLRKKAKEQLGIYACWMKIEKWMKDQHLLNGCKATKHLR